MRRPRLTAVVAALAVVLAPAIPSHAKLLGASPRPGSTVGGPISTFDVLLDQEALELHEMGLQMQTDRSEPGRELPGSWSQEAPNLLRFTAERPLATDGDYIVSYRVTVEDGDTTRSAFVFRYRSDAPAPAPVPAADVMERRSLVLPVVLAALVLAGVALLVIGLRRPRVDDPGPDAERPGAEAPGRS